MEGKSFSSLELLFILQFISVLCPNLSKVILPVVLSNWGSLKPMGEQRAGFNLVLAVLELDRLVLNNFNAFQQIIQ